MRNKSKIILISGTAGRLVDFEKSGFFNRQKRLIAEYSTYFDVEYYTSDINDYSSELDVEHHPLPLKINIYGVRHLLFWLYLIWRAWHMEAPIRVFGVAIPILPLIKLLSGQKLIVGFQWDYASVTKANYSGLKRWLAGTLQAAGLKSADLVICTTEQLKEIVEKKYKKPVEIVPNFVDTELFQREPKKGNFVLYAGRLHWAKGIDYLIRAFGMLKKKVKNARLVICGDGDSAQALKKLTEDKSISDVDFLGVIGQDRLAHLMAQAKAFILPTVNYEGHPKVLIEAMACGTVCIATDIPGSRDLIDHRKNGLLVQPKDYKGLYEALTLIYKNENFRRSLEKNAYLYSIRNFSIKSTLKKEVKLLRNWI